jgi:hypothetical protein
MPELWDATPGDLYDLDWSQCNRCHTWHQITAEDVEAFKTAIPDPERPNEVLISGEDGNTCPSCEIGELGEWLPRNAIGVDDNGELILRDDV